MSLAVFSGPTAKTEADLDRQCNFVQETEECIQDYVEDCMPEMLRLLMDDFLNGTSRLREDFCTPGSNLRTSFITHGACMDTLTLRPCLTDLKNNFEVIMDNSTSAVDRVNLMCCSFNQLTSCFKDIHVTQCGEGSWTFIDTIFKMLGGRMGQIVCEDYTSKHDLCKKLPPAGSPPVVPKKGKKTSVLNRLIGSYF